MPGTPKLTHVFDLDVLVGKPAEIGEMGTGIRRVIDILGGTLRGPGIAGTIRPGGADFQIIQASGLTKLHARYVIELDTGALAYVENDGIRFGPREALEKIRRGEPVDPELIYFRSAPRFETASSAHQWLMTSIFVATGVRHPDKISLSVFRVE